MGKKKRKKKFNKRGEFINQKKKPNSLVMGSIVIGVVVVAAIAIYTSLSPSKSSSSSSDSPNRTNVGTVSYTGSTEMADIDSKVENGKIVIDLEEVKKNKMVAFSYEKNIVNTGLGEQPLPLMAYITPKGDLVTAVAMCEPCKSIRFHYETDNTLTCNACGTKWDVETIEGISGACTSYPPDEVEYKLKSGKVLIDESAVSSWKPRV